MKNKDDVEFGSPQKVWDASKRMQDIEDARAADRAKINTLFNGARPYTGEEEKKFNIQINVNWGQGQRIVEDANRQLNNAFNHPGTMFQATLEDGPVEKRDEWSMVGTKGFHFPLQREQSGKRHVFLLRNRNASIALHGIGALWWSNPYRWMPRFVPLEDLLIPTDTYCDFANLRYFAINLYLTPGELTDLTQRENTIRGWNKQLVRQLLDANKDLYHESTPSTWRDQPEAMVEVHKQNRGYYYSDCVPKIKLRAFYFQEIDEPNRWYRHIIARETMAGAKIDKFVYDGTGIVFADSIDRILNVQYADSSIVAPLKYHSVRGLGVKLFSAVETLNRLQCEEVQHVFETLKMYFRIQDPADRDRLKQVVLQAYGFIPEGLQIVPRDQRHQIDPRLVESVMSQMRQVMQENSASYVRDTENTSGREMTAREAMIRLNQANAMIGGMLQFLYLQENFYGQELLRRFMEKDTDDPQSREFQKYCMTRGIPKEMLEYKRWNIQSERVLGGGDKSLAQAQSEWLLEHLQMYDPVAQQKIVRLATATVLDDPAKGALFVPYAKQESTSGTIAAENVFSTLMLGVECGLRQGIDQQGYIEAMLKSMGSVIVRIQNTDNVGTIDEIIGLQNVAKNVGQHLMIFAGDDRNKQLVRQFSDVLGNLMNEVKGFAQRLLEQRQKEADAMQGDPAMMAKAKGTILMAQTKARIAEMNAALKMKHKDMAFKMDQARRNMEAIADMDRQQMQHRQQMFTQSMSDAQKSLNEVRSANMQLIMDKKLADAERQNVVARGEE